MLPKRLDIRPSRKPSKLTKAWQWIGGLGVCIVLLIAALAPAAAGAAECTNTWVGPAEGTWQTGANWSAGHAPTFTEVACIGSGKIVNVTAGTNQAAVVQGEGTLTVKESTLEVLSASEASAIKNLTVKYNAVLTGPATVNVSNTFAWTHASTMSGSGKTVLGPEASGSITTGGGWANLKERRLVSEGSFAVNEGVLAMTEGGIFENKGTLTVNHEAGVFDILDNGGTIRPTLVNSGVLQKTAGTGETKFDVKFENPGGEINAQTGTFGFTLKGSTGVLGSGSTLKGSIRLQGPTFTAQSFSGQEANLIMRDASLSIDASTTGTIGNLTMDYKTVLSGAGTFELTKSLSWTGSDATMAGAGLTVIRPSATVTVKTYSGYLTTRTLKNEGTFNFEGEGSVRASEGATLENTATLNANAVVSYARFPGILTEAGSKAPVLVNKGTIQRTSGTSEFRLDLNVQNYTTITAKTGKFLYNQASSTVTLHPESVLEGTHRFEKSGISGNNFKVPSGTVSARESPITLEGENTTVENLEIDYGTTVSGPGDLEVAQSFKWNGQSTLGGSGKLTLAAGTANVLKSGATVATLSQREFINKGTFTQTSDSKLLLKSGAIFRNQGTYNLNSEPYPTWVRDSIRFEVGPAGNVFMNEGLFQRTEGKIPLEVTPEFLNLGVLKPQSSGIEIKNPVAIDRTEEFGKRSKCGDPIDCATGDFSEGQTDLFVGGRGVVLEMTRSYSAQAAAAASSSGAFGYGWTGSFSEHLTIEGGGEKATLVQADGSTIPFTKVSGTTYAGPAWSQNTLSGSPEAGYTVFTADQTELSFSGTGRLESAEDRNGNETTLSYDEAGRLKTVTDAAGRQLKLAYNGSGQVESVEDPMGHLLKYTYEGGHLTSVTLPGQETPRWKFKYDASHRITEMTDGRGGKTTNEYDASNRVKWQTDPGGHTLTFEYAAFHTKVTNKTTGAVTDQWFTSNNQPYSITHGYGTASATTQSFTYNEAGQLTSATDGNGHIKTYGYDATGNRTSEKDAAGNEAEWTFNGTHDLTSTTTPRGETTTITRDEAGNPEMLSRPGPEETAQTFTLEYDENGQLESVTDPLERTWSYAYNNQGDMVSESDPLGNTHSYEYDEDSRLVAAVSPRGNEEGAEPAQYETTIERDPLGRQVKVTDSLGHSTEYAYDGNGNLTTETNANANATIFVYNADDEQTKIEKPNGAILKTAYDGAGNVTSQTDANEQTTTYVRNVLGQPVEIVDPLSRKTLLEFDAAGNLKAITDPAERKTSFVYDAADRLADVNYSEEATPDVEFGYNADSDLTSMVDGTGESAFTYDVLGRLTQTENGKGAVVGYEYDLAEQLTKFTYPGEKSVSQAFDGAGRLESVTDWLGGTTSFGYDADSNLESITFPMASGNVDEFAYDPVGLVEKATYRRGVETLASISYVRNKVGQVKEASTQGLPGAKEASYGYDKANRLTGAGEASFEYDLADNLIKGLGTTNAYDKASQLETSTGVSYTYDKLGERTKRTPEGGSATTYGYSQAGELISVTRPAEGEVLAIGQSFAYDGVGLMASVTSGETTRNLTWDVGAALPLLLNDDQNSYIYGPSGLPVMQIPSGEEVPTYLHHDQLGSTRLLTDGTGKATGAFSYEPYGELAGATGSASTPLGFAGEYTDPASGLQYLRARFYDPATGQFLTRDPLEALTRQPYAYAASDPVNLVDRDGKVAAAACVGSAVIPVPVPNPCGAAKVGIGIAGGALAGAAAGLADDVFGGEEEVAGYLTISKGLAGRLVRSNDNEEAGCEPSDMPNFGDPSQAPGEDWGWKGSGPPGSKEGSWYNPKTGESLHPDLGHPGSIGPHYDYHAPNGSDHRVYPDGRVVPK